MTEIEKALLHNLNVVRDVLLEEPCEVIECDTDHIWYKGNQYISLRRFLEVKAEAEKENEKKVGKWLPIPYELDYPSDAECSLCHGQFIDAIRYDYCPYCGAKMEREDKE